MWPTTGMVWPYIRVKHIHSSNGDPKKTSNGQARQLTYPCTATGCGRVTDNCTQAPATDKAPGTVSESFFHDPQGEGFSKV